MMTERKFLKLTTGLFKKADRILDRLDSREVLFDNQFKRLDLAGLVILTYSEKLVHMNRTKNSQDEMASVRNESLRRYRRNLMLLKKHISFSKKNLSQ